MLADRDRFLGVKVWCGFTLLKTAHWLLGCCEHGNERSGSSLPWRQAPALLWLNDVPGSSPCTLRIINYALQLCAIVMWALNLWTPVTSSRNSCRVTYTRSSYRRSTSLLTTSKSSCTRYSEVSRIHCDRGRSLEATAMYSTVLPERY